MAQHRPLFRDTITVHPAVIVLCLVTHALLKWLFFSSFFQVTIAGTVHTATGGMVTPVLLAGLIEWTILVLVVMGLIGQMRAEDVGLERNHVLPALLVIGGLWILVQLGTVATGVFAHG
ncbi:MAG: hypothetical protein R3284_05935, partial [Rubricoccaceae bacterium]|nr:hypothetical protein [Rubricoccaceae bacterium]